MSGGAEAEATACHQKDQHLHRDLPRVLCSLRDYQVSLPVDGDQGLESQSGAHPGHMYLLRAWQGEDGHLDASIQPPALPYQ